MKYQTKKRIEKTIQNAIAFAIGFFLVWAVFISDHCPAQPPKEPKYEVVF
jgi:hypothetical protein